MSDEDRVSRGARSTTPENSKAAGDDTTSQSTSPVSFEVPGGGVVRGERFPVAARVLRRNHFGHVFEHGRGSSNSALRVVLAPNQVGHARLGLAVSRGVSKRAVVRNKVKRQLREIFRRHRDLIPPTLDIVVVPQRPVLELDFSTLRDQLLALIDAYWSRAQRFGHGDPAQERRNRPPRPSRKRGAKKAGK